MGAKTEILPTVFPWVGFLLDDRLGDSTHRCRASGMKFQQRVILPTVNIPKCPELKLCILQEIFKIYTKRCDKISEYVAISLI